MCILYLLLDCYVLTFLNETIRWGWNEDETRHFVCSVSWRPDCLHTAEAINMNIKTNTTHHPPTISFARLPFPFPFPKRRMRRMRRKKGTLLPLHPTMMRMMSEKRWRQWGWQCYIHLSWAEAGGGGGEGRLFCITILCLRRQRSQLSFFTVFSADCTAAKMPKQQQPSTTQHNTRTQRLRKEENRPLCCAVLCCVIWWW